MGLSFSMSSFLFLPPFFLFFSLSFSFPLVPFLFPFSFFLAASDRIRPGGGVCYPCRVQTPQTGTTMKAQKQSGCVRVIVYLPSYHIPPRMGHDGGRAVLYMAKIPLLAQQARRRPSLGGILRLSRVALLVYRKPSIQQYRRPCHSYSSR